MQQKMHKMKRKIIKSCLIKNGNIRKKLYLYLKIIRYVIEKLKKKLKEIYNIIRKTIQKQTKNKMGSKKAKNELKELKCKKLKTH